MKKLTRRSYNRKLIMLGLSLFISVGLITTGFSAWLISAVNGANANGDLVDVGTISADSVDIYIDQWTKGEGESTESWKGEIIRFDAKDGDNTGRVVYQADSAGLVENLDMVISGVVTNYTKVNTQMKIVLPDSLAAAVAANYITIANVGDSTGATWDADTKTITVDLVMVQCSADIVGTTYTETTSDATFTYTLTFAWGSYFGGLNPSEFYDSTEKTVNRGTDNDPITGADIPDAQVAAEMLAFRKVLTGNNEDDGLQPYTGVIDITVTPTLRSAGN